MAIIIRERIIYAKRGNFGKLGPSSVVPTGNHSTNLNNALLISTYSIGKENSGIQLLDFDLRSFIEKCT